MARNYSSLLAIFVLLSSGCKTQVTTRLKMSIEDNQGKPVAKAVVKIDGKEVGVSSDSGHFSYNLEVADGQTSRIEVVKESDTLYFAPYVEKITINEKTPPQVDLKATLYYVPKPTVTAQTEASPRVEDDIPAPAADKAEKKTEEAKQVEKKDVAPPVTDLLAQEAPKTEPAPLPVKPLHPLALTSQALPASPTKLEDVEKENTTSSLVYTVHVEDEQGTAVDKAEIYLGRAEVGELKPSCQTNARGRCVLHFYEKQANPVNFVVKKKFYLTQTAAARVADKGLLKVRLYKGRSLDIFALNKTYQFTQGLAGLEVYVNKKKVGKTDQLGHYSHAMRGSLNELISVSLRSPNYLPESFESDFMINDNMSLVRYFSPKLPPAAKLTILEAQLAGKAGGGFPPSAFAALDVKIRRAAQKYLFHRPPFQEFGLDTLKAKLAATGKTASTIAQKGWDGTPVKGFLDAILQPTVIHEGSQYYLELSFIDSHGQVVAAADAALQDKGLEAGTQEAIDASLREITQKIKRIFPFEGTILDLKKQQVVINIGSEHERSLQKGDLIEIYGTQVSSDGAKKEHNKTALAKIEHVLPSHSIALLQSQAPRSVLNRGDLIIMKQSQHAQTLAKEGNSKSLSSAGREIAVSIIEARHEGFPLPVKQANLYLNGQWLGASNDDGKVFVDPSLLGSGDENQLKVIKYGYGPEVQRLTDSHAKSLSFSLKRQSAFLKIESQPSGAEIILDERSIGKTPISSPVALPGGFVKMQVVAPRGYKTLTRILEMDDGTLDLTGPAAIQLEVDYLGQANRLAEVGKVQQAIAKLKEVDRNHSDFLAAQNLIGEIYLNDLNDPQQAAAVFSKLTAEPQVKEFQDKRFLSAHINEGLARFMLGEKEGIAAQRDLALSEYQKALDIFTNVSPFLRYVSKEQNDAVSCQVAYHRALTLQRIWELTKERPVLQEAYKQWSVLMQRGLGDGISDKEAKAYLENAKIYYRQAGTYLDQEV